jgi:hypothetical protein
MTWIDTRVGPQLGLPHNTAAWDGAVAKPEDLPLRPPPATLGEFDRRTYGNRKLPCGPMGRRESKTDPLRRSVRWTACSRAGVVSRYGLEKLVIIRAEGASVARACSRRRARRGPARCGGRDGVRSAGAPTAEPDRFGEDARPRRMWPSLLWSFSSRCPAVRVAWPSQSAKPATVVSAIAASDAVCRRGASATGRQTANTSNHRKAETTTATDSAPIAGASGSHA